MTMSAPPSPPTQRFDIPEALLTDDNPYKEELVLAVKLALQAGHNIEAHCESVGTSSPTTSLDIVTKGDNAADFATAVDVENERLVSEAVAHLFPDHAVIGEEATGTGPVASLRKDGRTWIVDPIDGTTNFTSGLPLCCVSVGLCDRGRPVLGVVYAPLTRELYAAVTGHGAYRNGVRIERVVRRPLRAATVVYELGYARSERAVDDMLRAVRNIMLHGCRTTRSLGSGVLDLCYAATGRVDVVYTGIANEGWKPWDYCAGMVVLEESGGCIRSLDAQEERTGEYDEQGRVVEGSCFDIYSDSMICGTHVGIVEECRKVVLGLEL